MIHSVEKLEKTFLECISYIKNLEKKILELEKELNFYRPKDKIKQTCEKSNPDDYLERKSRMLFSNTQDY